MFLLIQFVVSCKDNKRSYLDDTERVQGTGKHLISERRASGGLIDTQVSSLKACAEPRTLRTAFGQSWLVQLRSVNNGASALLKVMAH